MIRTRIAPSPTGLFHIGTLRTALFNYIFTKKNKGEFIIRIEDTDKERSQKFFEEDILKGLEDAGLIADESPTLGGKYGPYSKVKELIFMKIFNKIIRKRTCILLLLLKRRFG
jgi:glutamyl/glutaminyl-tRNA synthetase